MKLFLFSCLVLVPLAFTSAVDGDEKIELEPIGKPFPGLRRGNLDEIIPKANPEGRIVNGHYAANQQLPYQAGLLINFGTPNAYAWCGGTLLGNEWLITAAHCTSGAKSIEVRLGSVDRNKPMRTVWGLVNYVHSGWANNGDDIALLKIQWVDFNSDIAPALLPARNGRYSEYVNARVVASGWGGINDKGQGSDQLKYVLMTVMDKDTCARYYGPDAKRPSIMCTNTRGLGSTCSGDSGGPLVLENTRELVGIVTFGAANSCTGGYPAGFARITHYLDWINQVSGISH